MADNQRRVRKRVSIIGQSGVRKWTVRGKKVKEIWETALAIQRRPPEVLYAKDDDNDE